jgi:hypothetical protein
LYQIWIYSLQIQLFFPLFQVKLWPLLPRLIRYLYEEGIRKTLEWASYFKQPFSAIMINLISNEAKKEKFD